MDKKDLLATVRKRYRLAEEADHENRQEALFDMKFINVPGWQWDQNMKQNRGDRPCYEFNKLRVTAKRIINEMRANRVSGKVRGVEDSDSEKADIYEGLIRNIWNRSDGDSVIDYASEYQVSSGLGAWRITTDYVADDMFEQDIKIEPIKNPFCLYVDPSCQDFLKRDAKYYILTERIPMEDFEAKYPKADTIDFDPSEFDDDEEWQDDETVRICEYWYKEPYKKEIWQLQDGKVIDSESDEAQSILQFTPELIKNKRISNCEKVMMCIASGEAILEGPTEWAGKEFPFVMVYGEHTVIDGKERWYGIGRFAKDAQRSYNVSRTAITETIAQAPQAKWWATPAQADGHTDKWAEAHQKNFPFLLANPDPKQPGFPQRMGGADVPIALIQESQLASEEIKAVTGIFSADIGAPNQATSGRQEIARQQQGQIATFNYQDNLAKGIRRTWEILIDLIPKIYDTEREMRILGPDESEEYVRINTFTPGPNGPIKINDITVGRYDVTITSGPSFATKRQEAAEIYQSLMQSMPEVGSIAGDLIFRSMDLPYADDIAERLKVLLPPEIQDLINKDKSIPPEVQMMMQQAQQAMQMVQQQMQEAQKTINESEISKAEVEKQIARLKEEEAKFEAKVAKEMADIAKSEADLKVKALDTNREQILENDRQAFSIEMANAIQNIQQMAAQFNDYAAGVVDTIRQEKDSKPKIVRIEQRRERGKLIATPIYEEESGPEVETAETAQDLE